MTVTEFAIIVFKSPPSFSDPTLQPLFEKLSAWQSECSGFQLLFFTDADDARRIHLVTGWASVAAHEAWIAGERNQELLRVFGPYIDMSRIRMVHLDVDFEAIPRDVLRMMVVERYEGSSTSGGRAGPGSARLPLEGSSGTNWLLFGRRLAQVGGGDVYYRFVGVDGPGSGAPEVGGGASVTPVERWVLKRVGDRLHQLLSVVVLYAGRQLIQG